MRSEPSALDTAAALEIVYAAIAELNRQLPPEQRVAQSPEAPFAGAASQLDSLSIITVLASVEQAAGERGAGISLLDHPALGEEGGPFSTLGGLAALIAGK